MTDTTVIVHREHGLLRAQAVKARLESEGIPTLLSYESAGPVLGVTVDGLGEVEIRVPACFAARARRLLSSDQPLPPRSPRRRVRRNLRARRYPPEPPTGT